MGADNNEQGLDSLLIKVVDACRLREELTRIGFSKKETVKVSIETFDGETIATSQIKTSGNKFEPCLPLSDFREELISFLSQDFHGSALIEALPKAKKANYIFSITSTITSVLPGNDCNTSSEYEEGENTVDCLPIKLQFAFAYRHPCPDGRPWCVG